MSFVQPTSETGFGHREPLLLLEEHRLTDPDGLIYPCNNFNLETISKTRD